MKAVRWGLLVAVVGLVGFSSVDARANHASRLERFVCELNTHAQNLAAEIQSQYRPAPQFPCLANESSRILGLASQSRELIANCNRPQLQRNLCEVERLARHIQDELDNVDDFMRGGPRHCRIDTRRAYRLAEDIEDVAVDLKDEAQDLPSRPFVQYESVPSYGSQIIERETYYYPPSNRVPAYSVPSYSVPRYTVPNYNTPHHHQHGYERSTSNRPAIQFGAGGFSIRFGG